MIITIDGPAGTGKSIAAQTLADAIGFTYFDTGALYRAISWQILQQQTPYQDETTLELLLKYFSFNIRAVNGAKRYFVGSKDVTEVIRSKEVTAIVSEVAALKKVRDALKPLQVDFSKHANVVFEGRDLGTAVFPHADLKFFLTARLEVRAKRRYLELAKKFPNQKISYATVLKDIQKRDIDDSNRDYAPLKQAEDAILVDTSDLSIEEVTNKLKRIYEGEKKHPGI